MQTPVPPRAFDAAAVQSWMTEQGLGAGPLEDTVLIGGGSQNVMVSFTCGGRRYVLRRGPEHMRKTSNESLRREMRVLTALADTAVPHPRLIAGCTDDAVLGDSVFYLMEPVNGFNADEALPSAFAVNQRLRHRLGLAAIDALCALHQVDYQRVGLSDFGRPEGFLQRQVPRWLGELESYSGLRGYTLGQLPGAPSLATWLEANMPPDGPAGLMHGDYHIANVMFDQRSATVAAIVDWEMCTIGDPLLDLGWWLALWPHPGFEDSAERGPVLAAGGEAVPSDLVRHYATRTQRDMSAITWYTVMACFKLGIVLEGTHARACAGRAPMDVGNRLHQIARRVFDRAHALSSGAIPLL